MCLLSLPSALTGLLVGLTRAPQLAAPVLVSSRASYSLSVAIVQALAVSCQLLPRRSLRAPCHPHGPGELGLLAGGCCIPPLHHTQLGSTR